MDVSEDGIEQQVNAVVSPSLCGGDSSAAG